MTVIVVEVVVNNNSGAETGYGGDSISNNDN